MLKVAIIDDGINEALLDSQHKILHYTVFNNKVIRIDLKFDTYNTHGTKCIKIFYNYLKDECELYSIKILDSTNKTCNIKCLLIALKWCLKNNIKVINLSLGTTYYKDFYLLENILLQLYLQKIIVVSSYSNYNRITYPASSKYALGVRSYDINLSKDNIFYYNSYAIDGIEIIATCNYNGNIKSNSFTTAYICATVCNIVQNYDISLNEVKNILFSISKNNNMHISNENIYNIYKGIDNYIKSPTILLLKTDSTLQDKYTKSIVKLFRKRDYYAISLSENLKSDILKGIYNLNSLYNNEMVSIKEAIYLFYNMCLPDIIIASLNLVYENIKVLHLLNLFDLIVDKEIRDGTSQEIVLYNEDILKKIKSKFLD